MNPDIHTYRTQSACANCAFLSSQLSLATYPILYCTLGKEAFHHYKQVEDHDAVVQHLRWVDAHRVEPNGVCHDWSQKR